MTPEVRSRPGLSARDPNVFVLSAASASELAQSRERVIERLRTGTEADLSVEAHALQDGCEKLAHRCAVVADSREEALRELATGSGARAWTAVVTRSIQTCFVFPGVGEQYPGMARELYERAPAFRAVLDRNLRLIERELGEDAQALLFPAEQRSRAHGGPNLAAMLGRSEGDDGLRATRLAQPLVFAIEHALTELLGSFGVRPSAVLGYSVGEYVAACVAGVLSPEDALRLASRRALLIERLPPGAMLAVAAASAEVRPLLGEGLWVAAENNAETTVVAGRLEAVADMERRLTDAGLASRPVLATHAFHTPLLAPAGAALTALASEARRSSPRIPFISNLTGGRLSARDATDPSYWARHMCEPVRFAAGIQTLLALGDAAVLEVGPGQGLTSFIKQSATLPPAQRARTFATLPGPYQGTRADTALLVALARLWVAGVDVDWRALRRSFSSAGACDGSAEGLQDNVA